jgi:hypothetical protein
MASPTIDFQDAGIATILQQYSLTVPVNQRPYAWEATHVEDLFTDLARAIDNNESEYFLGTMVAIRPLMLSRIASSFTPSLANLGHDLQGFGLVLSLNDPARMG